MRVGVLSDTHIPSRARTVPAEVFRAFDGAEAVLHAGDLCVRSVLDELGMLAPVYGVLGNIDDPWLGGVLPVRRRLDLGGVAVGMVHDSGPSRGRRGRMKQAFPGCRVVVFGHSHMPLIEDDGELLLLNPGSACDPRGAKVPTVAILEIGAGGLGAELVPLGRWRA